MRNCLDRFCHTSRQKVNLMKSKILFSRNVSNFLAKENCEGEGIGGASKFGTYLGFFDLDKANSKGYFLPYP